jgi:hypothetical protein
MKNFNFLLAILVLNALLFTACDKVNEPTDEQELITNVWLDFHDIEASRIYTFLAMDSDGNGGNPPLINEIKLYADKYYLLNIRFTNNSNSSSTGQDITAEIVVEGTDHLVCLEGTGAMPEPIINDKDNNGNPLGLESAFMTGDAGTGTLQISLKHLPDKAASDPCSTGDTDVDVTFNVTIQ